jgi:hypothetical protein
MQAIEQIAVGNEDPAHATCVPSGFSGATNGATSRARCEDRVATTMLRAEERASPPELMGGASEAALTEGRVEPGLLGLVRAQAPIRRALAALAGRFVWLQGWEPLGFARLGDYGRERLGLSARTLYDLAHTDGVLADLPEIDRGFVRGELSWTKVRLLARVAKRGDSAHWLALAHGMTSAALAREVRAVNVGAVERDGWRCTVPGCSSLMNLHDHHIVFRSAGGSNDPSNRTTLCAWHHLRGVHGGVVRCVGKAPSELRFELGVRPGARPLLGFGPGERRARA